jgi:Rps23 Pro-64 3,4-dihydroxylase Tpa1-like proline 4-hydroxylase
MTAQEILFNLSGSLLEDDRILNARERELLASLLQHTTKNAGPRDNAVAEIIARAVGEVVAQRAYAILGASIAERLLDPSGSYANSPLRAHSPHPPSPSPPGPGTDTPTGPRPAPTDIPAGPRTGPRPAPTIEFASGPRPADDPGGPRPGPRPGPGDPGGPRPGPRPGPGDPGGPRPGPRPLDDPGGPRPGPRPPVPGETPAGPRGVSADANLSLRDAAVPQAVQTEGNVAVLEAPETLPARCVVLDEFLAPAEVEALMAHTLAKESEFEVSEVISPEIGGGVDFDYRRSRILQDLGAHRDVMVSRIQACLPRILEQLEHEEYPVSRVEAQITASNDGDFFRWHNDNGEGEIASREITFVYFFHREPKQFQGGELRLYDSRWSNGMYRPESTYRTIVPQQNQLICFLSSLAHEITPVECPSRAFADSRFTLNGWLHK